VAVHRCTARFVRLPIGISQRPRPYMTSMRISLGPATADDAEALAALQTDAAAHLTTTHGRGNWSSSVTRRGVLGRMRTGTVFVARRRGRAIATLCLTTRKPWAIDPSYFTPVPRPLYLVDMAVAPDLQGTGIGRMCLHEAERIARAWPADAIRLDAWDAPAGAGAFYQRCGYREAGRKVYRGSLLVYYELVLEPPAPL
jgi:GNAT superfamily N-acetyltransferase